MNPPSPRRTFDDAQRLRAHDLIERLADPSLPDKASGELLDELYPGVSDLLFWRTPGLTVDEVIDEALRYQPFDGQPAGEPSGARTHTHRP